jgi:hypothetical protein
MTSLRRGLLAVLLLTLLAGPLLAVVLSLASGANSAGGPLPVPANFTPAATSVAANAGRAPAPPIQSGAYYAGTSSRLDRLAGSTVIRVVTVGICGCAVLTLCFALHAARVRRRSALDPKG